MALSRFTLLRRSIALVLGSFSEPWHWSYAPLSKSILTQYLQKVNYTHLKGFSGDDLAEAVNVIQEYVGGVNPALK
jgi:hypothetical protein